MKRLILMCTFMMVVASAMVYGFTVSEHDQNSESPTPIQQSKSGPSTDKANKSNSQTTQKVSPMSSQSDETAAQDYNPLTPDEARVILFKGTEWSGTGEYTKYKAKGTYICRRCNAPLYDSKSKFQSDCGWPSFDDQIKGAVRREPDADGFRVEILCENCGGHLGHVFEGERFTEKNTRHCVNSISMKFIAAGKEIPPTIKKKTSGEENKAISDQDTVPEKDTVPDQGK